MSDRPGSGAARRVLDPDRIRFVLVQPQSGGNVGSAARALMNLGFSRLHLVRPACDPLGSEARMMAVDAAGLLERAEVHDELPAALAGAGAVLGTSRRTGKHRRPHWRLDQCSGRIVELARSTDVAVVFGREDHGLADADLDRCTHLAHLPAASAYPSFNLAQAVLLVAYQLRMTGFEVPAEPALSGPAPDEQREELYLHLEQAWRTIGFLSEDTTEMIMRRFRRLLGRAAMTADEVKLLRGVARQTLWAARRAGLPVAAGPEPDTGDQGQAGDDPCTTRN
jgi:TrmH family RNA methyltransferase